MKLFALFRLFVIIGVSALSVVASYGQSSIPSGADNFAGAASITGRYLTSSDTDLFPFSSEVSEPLHRPSGELSARKSAWWKWTAPESGWCTVDTFDEIVSQPVLSTVLAVYIGESLATLVPVAKNESAIVPGVFVRRSAVTFRAGAGVTYFIAVDGRANGDVAVDKRFVSMNLAFMADGPAKMVGYFAGSEASAPLNAYLTSSKTASNSISGRLNLRGKVAPFRGVVQPNGRVTCVVHLKGDPVPVVLHLQYGGLRNVLLQKGNDAIEGRFIPAAVRNRFPVEVVSRHTAVMEGASGYSVGSYTIAKSGMCKGAFVMEDGTAFSISGPLIYDAPTDGKIFLAYRGLFQNQGLAMLLLEPGTLMNGSAIGFFHRPASPTSSFLPAGINAEIQGESSPYTPSSGGRLFSALDASDGAGNLVLEAIANPADPFPGLTLGLQLSRANRFSFSDKVLNPKLSINLRTGLVAGQIRSAPGQPLMKISGAVLGIPAFSVHFYGHFRTRTSTGNFMVSPPLP